MATKRNDSHIPPGREPPASPESGARPRGGRRRRVLVAAVIGAAALAALSALAAVGAFNGNASALTNCAATPSRCGYPDATNTGVPGGGTTLKSVPGQVSSGTGWSYNAAGGDVIVTGNGTVLSGLYIPHELVINASSVTVKDVQVAASGDFGIRLAHTKGVTIENSTISGQNATTGRVGSAIDDVYGDSTGMVIKDNNISDFKTAIQISTGLVDGNYIHDPGYIAGDHTNGFFINGGNEAADDREQHDLRQPEPDRRHQPRRGKLRRAGGEQDRREQPPRRRRLHHLRRHGPEQPHLEHRHQGQPVRPAIPPEERPVRPRRLLQPHRHRQHLVRQLLGHHRAGPFPPRDRRTTTGRATSARRPAPGQAAPVGPAELARHVGLNTTMIGTSPVPGLSARSGHLAEAAQSGSVRGYGRPLSASVRDY